VVAVDDEVEALDALRTEHRAPRLIDGDVTEAVPLQVRLEGRLVVVRAVHGKSVPEHDPV